MMKETNQNGVGDYYEVGEIKASVSSLLHGGDGYPVKTNADQRASLARLGVGEMVFAQLRFRKGITSDNIISAELMSFEPLSELTFRENIEALQGEFGGDLFPEVDDTVNAVRELRGGGN